ncbi:uncharacterized protein LOC127790938 [Diospyros lotus]|uniref:uncharacterized protein LOC127790938 n=1 Tax=Diospyros lotus TaxID=55363 RepID=UPI002258B4D0|nr:uncharacterized protein LOC127790938 [Diospyros lotus]
MDFWQRARSFAGEASKRSQEVTVEAAKRSQEFTISSSSKLAEIVLLASKRSKEIATEASKRAKEEVLKRADQITQIPAAALSSIVEGSLSPRVEEVNATADLEKFGVTDELRELAKRMSVNTFRDFPLEGEFCLDFHPFVWFLGNFVGGEWDDGIAMPSVYGGRVNGYWKNVGKYNRAANRDRRQPSRAVESNPIPEPSQQNPPRSPPGRARSLEGPPPPPDRIALLEGQVQ